LSGDECVVADCRKKVQGSAQSLFDDSVDEVSCRDAPEHVQVQILNGAPERVVEVADLPSDYNLLEKLPRHPDDEEDARRLSDPDRPCLGGDER
jgi:hypothetical protein